jgi:hypothetical protein
MRTRFTSEEAWIFEHIPETIDTHPRFIICYCGLMLTPWSPLGDFTVSKVVR